MKKIIIQFCSRFVLLILQSSWFFACFSNMPSGLFLKVRCVFPDSDFSTCFCCISATSNGQKTSLDHTSGGRCSTHNMRMNIYICNDENGMYCIDRVTSDQKLQELIETLPRPRTANSFIINCKCEAFRF